MNQSIEQWRPVVGYEAIYEVSDLGRVRRVLQSRGARANHVLKPHPGTGLYLTYVLCRDGIKRTHSAHRIVIEAFQGPCPDGMECCHQNGDPTDNRAANLRWDTVSANKFDTVRHGTHRNSRKTHCIRGHLLEAPNLMRNERRQCRACSLTRMRARDRGVDFDNTDADALYAEIMRSV